MFADVASPDPGLLFETTLAYLPRLRRCVRVVVVMHRRTQRLVLLFSTDLDLDPVTLYRYYQARFQMEFLFRDSQHFERWFFERWFNDKLSGEMGAVGQCSGQPWPKGNSS